MPTQIYVFNMPVNVYTFAIAITMIAGAAWALWKARFSWPIFSATLNGLLIGALTTVVCGRAGYVLLNLNYFQEHAGEIVSAASPGLWEQAAVAGWLVGWLIARRFKQATPAISYIVLATLTGIGAAGGCIPLGCGYGREVFWTDGWLWQLRVDWPDAYLINNPRLPAQDILIVWLSVCFIVTWVALARRWRVALGGSALLLWALLFGAGDFLIQFTRADAVLVFGPDLLRASQWADIALVVACSLILIVRLRRSHNNINTIIM